MCGLGPAYAAYEAPDSSAVLIYACCCSWPPLSVHQQQKVERMKQPSQTGAGSNHGQENMPQRAVLGARAADVHDTAASGKERRAAAGLRPCRAATPLPSSSGRGGRSLSTEPAGLPHLQVGQC